MPYKLVPFLEGLLDASRTQVENSFGKPLKEETFTRFKKSLLAPFYIPATKDALEEITIKENITPESWIERTLDFMKNRSGTKSVAIPTQIVVPWTELGNRKFLVGKVLRVLPYDLARSIFACATSPPVCTAYISSEAEFLLGLRDRSPRGIDELQRTAILAQFRASPIDAAAFLRKLSGSSETSGENPAGSEKRPGQYL